MPERHVIVESTASNLCEKAAIRWRELSQKAIAERGRFNVVLSGGSTPRELYQILASRGFRMQINWAKTEFFFGDERSVPADDPDSNFRMVREALFEKIALADDQIHRMRAEAEDLEGAAAAYQERIASRFEIDADGNPPAFDLVLLGMGPDGHTASLFPHTSAVAEQQRWVVANNVPQLETRRMTMTVPLINTARSVVFLIAGESKANPLFEVLCGAGNPELYPAQRIAPTSGSLTYFLDGAAAAKLPDSIVG